MKIKHTQIKVRDLVEAYNNEYETGRVSGYSNKLDIRPAYQREFVYKDAQRNAVIETILKGFPLNVMYWAKNGDDSFEVLDGQQRTISICEYVAAKSFSLPIDGNNRYFFNLNEEEKNKILDYELDVYQCEGNAGEKLDWFKTINIAGEKLTDQELRNAVYTGPWLSSAKKYFSMNNGPAYNIGKDYMAGSPIRQDYLETVITWITDRDGISIDEYMGLHQNDENADELWEYYKSVLEWVKMIFTTYRKEMKGLDWGILYNQYKDNIPNATVIEQKIVKYMEDEDVTNKKGIYSYLFTNDERKLSIRAFTPNMKREAYERQNHKCPHCMSEGIDREWELEEMEGDHILPWSLGGRTIASNCQMLCKAHNRAKSDR